MKYFLYIFAIFFSCASVATASSSLSAEQTDRIALYCKVWGMLKYFHPAVADHNVNWDSTFITYYNIIKSTTSKEEFNAVLYSLYKEAENKRDNTKHHIVSDAKYAGKTILPIVIDDWFNDPHFTTEISNALHHIKQDFTPQKNFFVSPTGGNTISAFMTDSLWYKGLLFPPEPIRVLALSRYWNIIEYFYPYKEGLSWDSILKAYIPLMADAQDTLYHLKIMELCTEIIDGHSATSSAPTLYYFGTGKLPIEISYIEGKTVIVNSYPPSTPNANSTLSTLGLAKGDIILRINGIETDTVRSRFRKIAPHSNEVSLQNILNMFITTGDTSRTAILSVDDGTKVKEVSVKYLSTSSPSLSQKRINYDPAWKIIQSNIGYIDLSRLTEAEIDTAMADLFTTRTLIFDIRGYPNNTVRHLMDLVADSVNMVVCAIPIMEKPGSLVKVNINHNKTTSAANVKKYKGYIVLLVNENTMSHAEYSTMMFQAIEGTLTFGSQTAGADGNISYIFLPGGVTTRMSGIGIYYPDGTPTQRIGVKIDFMVTPSVKGVREGRDEVLEVAINYIRYTKNKGQGKFR